MNKIDLFQSHTPFKFGNGRKILSEKRAIIPAIGDTECKIDVEIVNAKIPLLLSKSSLKKANTVIDLQNDRIKMFDKSIDVKVSSNGHYAIDILQKNVLNFHETEQVLVLENYKSKSEKTKALMKINLQFGYASSVSMKGLLKQANLLNNIKNPLNIQLWV